MRLWSELLKDESQRDHEHAAGAHHHADLKTANAITLQDQCMLMEWENGLLRECAVNAEIIPKASQSVLQYFNISVNGAFNYFSVGEIGVWHQTFSGAELSQGQLFSAAQIIAQV